MRKKDVQIGQTYVATVSGKRTHVRIDREAGGKGWWATNLATKREVRILTAARLTPTLADQYADQASKLRAQLRTKTNRRDGLLYWKSNGRLVPLHVFEEAKVPAPEGQREAIAREIDRICQEYRERMANHVHSDEELFEMRAAFGEGATVVNVITGKKTQL